MARKNGCPVNITNWLVYIADESLTPTDENYWVRINGLTSLSRTIEGDTEDGAADSDPWAEPYVNKRSGSLDLEGNLVIDEASGDVDMGQEMLNSYGEYTGCDGDAKLKFIDPYGHGWIGDYVVTSVEDSADDSEQTKSWSLEQVGAAETIPYISIKSIKLQMLDAADGTYKDVSDNKISLTAGGAAAQMKIVFTPNNASNKRFKISNRKRSVATVTNIDSEGTFQINPIAAGETAIGVIPVNNIEMMKDSNMGKDRVALNVTVAAGDETSGG